jgi:hypothetical protein
MATLAIFPALATLPGGNTYYAIPDAAHRHLRRFHQQEAQQSVALFRDMSQSSLIPARLL